MKSGSDIHGAQMKNPTDFGGPLTSSTATNIGCTAIKFGRAVHVPFRKNCNGDFSCIIQLLTFPSALAVCV